MERKLNLKALQPVPSNDPRAIYTACLRARRIRETVYYSDLNTRAQDWAYLILYDAFGTNARTMADQTPTHSSYNDDPLESRWHWHVNRFNNPGCDPDGPDTLNRNTFNLRTTHNTVIWTIEAIRFCYLERVASRKVTTRYHFKSTGQNLTIKELLAKHS